MPCPNNRFETIAQKNRKVTASRARGETVICHLPPSLLPPTPRPAAHATRQSIEPQKMVHVATTRTTFTSASTGPNTSTTVRTRGTTNGSSAIRSSTRRSSNNSNSRRRRRSSARGGRSRARPAPALPLLLLPLLFVLLLVFFACSATAADAANAADGAQAAARGAATTAIAGPAADALDAAAGAATVGAAANRPRRIATNNNNGTGTDTNTIVDVAVANNFTTLVKALNAVNLTDALKGVGPFTVFAPTDAAFGKLANGTLEALLQPENSELLTDILLFHVISPANITSGELTNFQVVESLSNGANLTITVDSDMNVTVMDANVILADVLASNGVVHVIDSVLIPPTTNNTEATNSTNITDPDPAAAADTNTIVDVAVANNFTTLVTALNAVNLTDALKGVGPFTVFAPTDAAFGKLANDTLKALLQPENSELLSDILLFHVISPANITSGDLTDFQVVESLSSGANLTIMVDSDMNVTVMDANVILADVLASNGVIHVIDTVLIPPTTNNTEATNSTNTTDPEDSNSTDTNSGIGNNETSTIVDLATASANLTTLVTALKAADLVDALSGEGPFTVFAPTDQAAFDNLPNGTTVEALLEDLDELRAILTYHVAEGNVTSSDLSDGQIIKTLNGENVNITFTEEGGVMVNDANVILPDVFASNGVIHFIDSVLIPPPSDDVGMNETNTTTTIPPDCGTLKSCVECLNEEGCGAWSTDTCFSTCSVGDIDGPPADASCYKMIEEYNTTNAVCTRVNAIKADAALCSSITNCSTCVGTALSDETSFYPTCQWYPDAATPFCASRSGFGVGEGVTTCTSTGPPPTPAPPTPAPPVQKGRSVIGEPIVTFSGREAFITFNTNRRSWVKCEFTARTGKRRWRRKRKKVSQKVKTKSVNGIQRGQIVLKDLTPGVLYYYRFRVRRGKLSGVRSFTTPSLENVFQK